MVEVEKQLDWKELKDMELSIAVGKQYEPLQVMINITINFGIEQRNSNNNWILQLSLDIIEFNIEFIFLIRNYKIKSF